MDFQRRGERSPPFTNVDRYFTVLTARGLSATLQEEMEDRLNARLRLLSHAYPERDPAGQMKHDGKFSLSVLHGAAGKVAFFLGRVKKIRPINLRRVVF